MNSGIVNIHSPFGVEDTSYFFCVFYYIVSLYWEYVLSKKKKDVETVNE
ncbi:MAG: hypothetical protein SCARUB_04106 [Candidatus Scalindua rubra]|uniref:Uncharacterized protein n=1 Tax=Candidatus Scalindua rubra TaxID=1872076 RepID=A0A1E3X591_9BACT|nr:MAG: hypothetical protein SCARUB_04106 [Candidatus Scalindua rubra]